jgi:hypothetical protein
LYTSAYGRGSSSQPHDGHRGGVNGLTCPQRTQCVLEKSLPCPHLQWSFESLSGFITRRHTHSFVPSSVVTTRGGVAAGVLIAPSR